jgi:Ca-activated chloride channel family protein
VKIQVEFDPKQVKRYRLAGYENRAIADRDFRNDKVDAGEVGSGHTVTALYELELQPGADHEALATVRIRAKKPRGERADEWAFPFRASAFASSFEQASQDFRFASAVMAAAEKLRRSPHAQGWDFDQVLRIARASAPAESAERQEFAQLLERARPLVGAVAAK